MKTIKTNVKILISLAAVLMLTSACGSARQVEIASQMATVVQEEDRSSAEDTTSAAEDTTPVSKPIPLIDLTPVGAATASVTAEDHDTPVPEAIGAALEYFKGQRESLELPTEEDTPSEEDITFFLEVISNQPTRPDQKYEGEESELIRFIKENTAAGTPETGTDIFQSEYGRMAEVALLQALRSWKNTATNISYDDYLTIRDVTVYVEEGWCASMAVTDQSERRMTIYIDSIRNYADRANVSTMACLTYNFMHELNHLRATLSTEEKAAGKGIYSFDYDEDVDTFITESSAESELYAGKRSPVTLHTYPKEREAEAEMMLFALLQDDMSHDAYYSAVFNNDLGGVFDFLGFGTMEELRELYRFWYATDAVLGRNNYLQKVFEEPKDAVNARREIHTAYKERFFLFFVEKLLAYTRDHETFMWEDNLLFYQMASVAALNDTKDAEDFRYDREMAERLKEHAMRYHAFLSEYYDVAEEEVMRYSEEVIPSVIRNMNALTGTGEHTISSTGMGQAKDILARYPLLEVILMGDTMMIGMDYD